MAQPSENKGENKFEVLSTHERAAAVLAILLKVVEKDEVVMWQPAPIKQESIAH